MRKSSKILFAISVLALLTGCGGSGGGGGTQTAALVSIAVTPANPIIPAGVTKQFTATGTYSDGTSQDITAQVTWSFSNTSVATVDGNGLATAVAAGTATITAASGNISGSTILAVTSATLSSLSVTPANPIVPAGLTEQFTATGTYSDGTSYDITTQVIWSSSSPSVATVNNNGLATAVTAGTATITATLGGISGNTTLTVTSAILSSISVTPANPSVPAGKTQQFTATGTYSDGTSHDITTQVTWSSSSPSVATVNSSGMATAVTAGTATITATSGSISGNMTLTVTAATLSSIAVTPATASVVVGGTQQLTATGTYSDGSTQNITTQATWSSSNTSVATVNSSGLATAIAEGSATITAALSGISGTATLTVTSSGVGNNIVSITVNGPGLNNSYPNEPCVSVTVCIPGTTTCQTISDILLDTGSFGLRIFKQALTVSLTQVPSGSGSLAECVQYADGSADWGPVQTASIILGNEPAVQVPIQVIDSTFGSVPRTCGTPDTSPSEAGFNGILGVGLFAQDCGSGCVNSANNGWYYSCSGSNCTGTTVALVNQVQNPVALLPQDNNGVIVQLPSISLSGSPSVNGSLILGIGTQSNNVFSGATAFPANQVAEFTTTFNGTSYPQSFIDSGSNGLFFPSTSQLPKCSDDPDWFCPSSTVSLSATNTGASGSPSGTVSFQIGNFDSLYINSSNKVFNDIGGTFRSGFDWGLPFFFGRNVYVGLEGKESSLGTGPFWAY